MSIGGCWPPLGAGSASMRVSSRISRQSEWLLYYTLASTAFSRFDPSMLRQCSVFVNCVD